ncbi:MAG: UDP-N-acetylmuramoyl-L-alanyl-D-glutamate--2,6-diaminopimelate ligase [Candidatus Marinimicrobia bacterium]|nr:UDP-N-acetylmuramoyl-L-alanyl-D-glutamate--2,6-diaminopimelate ligase [Candidatus Neomarinimicrobiota bacterium]
MNKNTEHVLNGLTFELHGKLPPEIESLQNNSKHVKDGDLFFAIRGTQADGHDYISHAVKNGAAAIVAEKLSKSVPIPQIIVKNSRAALALAAANFYNHPSKRLKLIGVTGTNGKTTTVYILNQILRTAGKSRATIGTLGYSVGDTLHSLNLTTPDSIQLQELLATMVSQNTEYVIMEVSAHALSLNRVDNIDFLAAVFTNISQDHLDFYKTIDNYATAKTRLFTKVSPNGFRISNADDAYHNTFKSIGNTAIYSYSISKPSDFHWNPDVEYENGINGVIQSESHQIPIKSRLSGRFNLSNILAAVSTAVCLGIDPKHITAALGKIQYIPGRLQEIHKAGFPRTFIDYAHTPDAISNVLEALRDMVPNKGKLITVFGCGGNRDRAKRPLMARAAAASSDITIVTTDNPRFEEPEAIINDAIAGFSPRQKYQKIIDRREAIKFAVENGNENDIVAILGKGHEDYQDIKGKKYPFSDIQVVRELMELK